MSSSPRVILSRCTCGASKSSIPARSLSTSSKKAASTTPSSSSSSSSSKNTHVHPIKPRQRWVMPDFQARKRAVNLPAPRAQKFENKLTMADGSVLSIYSTSPRPNIAIAKDTSNNPLWAFVSGHAREGMAEDEGGRMGRFARRFGGGAAPPPSTSEASASTPSTATPSTTRSKAEAAKPSTPSPSSSSTTNKETEEAKKTSEANIAQLDEFDDMFDLSLEGEEYVEDKAAKKIIQQAAAAASAGGKGKKGGKKK